ncbi:TIGR02530 family flagellar biosynthesis protein [Paenibacillus macquariensis]|uniref:Flagellar operon protein n=1 Tax=Paenibacillus macquariensis TaxID=948756 RepID=A0ABY1JZY3_9BACL|nr:TIGR02530 family flagellar biosynthesis protein [Paenibacillus macquariensis]MEC0091402.1 TIGR02530 family flagellar biosynthesis protein [Paenibacillus macquariensis]OAB38085.1 flagellar biosynthesis protein [Paenibacillus macquariensis subsp. macquariensis]SIR05974.1 flagellar operon protein [Paenibacillus macquariensis]
MSERMTIGQLYPAKVNPVASSNRSNARKPQIETDKASFDQLLQKNLLKFSNHAAKRLEQRGIEIPREQLARISDAVDQAAAKGSKESLILLNDMALIVNIPNRTVVTAMDGGSMKDNVFTKIDSAVIIS